MGASDTTEDTPKRFHSSQKGARAYHDTRQEIIVSAQILRSTMDHQIDAMFEWA